MEADRKKQLASLSIIAGLVVMGWAVICFVNPNGPFTPWEELSIGLLVGTMLGQVSLSAMWCALGPFPLVRRLPLAFSWITAIVIALGFNLRRTGGPDDSVSVLLVFGLAVLGQWMLVQMPMWAISFTYRVRIAWSDPGAGEAEASDQQFGIRQLMIITAVVAILLGTGRAVFGRMPRQSAPADWDTIWIFGTWAVGSALVAYPLVVAALRHRIRIREVTLALGLVALITVAESQVFIWLIRPPIDSYRMLFWMNGFQCLWILVPLLTLRSGGFRLFSRATGSSPGLS